MNFGKYEMNEGKFYKMIGNMFREGRITKEEHDMMDSYICAIYDYCDGMGFSLNDYVIDEQKELLEDLRMKQQEQM